MFGYQVNSAGLGDYKSLPYNAPWETRTEFKGRR